ncbi:MAG: hypothetical protein WCJ64_00855 [Rhodospirillaceae bacterium]
MQLYELRQRGDDRPLQGQALAGVLKGGGGGSEQGVGIGHYGRTFRKTAVYINCNVARLNATKRDVAQLLL